MHFSLLSFQSPHPFPLYLLQMKHAFQYSFLTLFFKCHSSLFLLLVYFTIFFFLPIFCLSVLLLSFCPISKSPYQLSLLSLNSDVVCFNRSQVNSHGFHLHILTYLFFLHPVADLPSHPRSCFSLSPLYLAWTSLSTAHLTPLCSSPSLLLSCPFSSNHLKTNKLPNLPSSWLLSFPVHTHRCCMWAPNIY